MAKQLGAAAGLQAMKVPMPPLVFRMHLKGTVRFQRFFQWALPSWNATITDVLPHGDGALMMGIAHGTDVFGVPGAAPQRSGVVDFEPDAGLRRVSLANVGMETENFVVKPDGGAWLVGRPTFTRPNTMELGVQWGLVDAGHSGSASDGTRALLDFDELSFQPVNGRIIPPSSSSFADIALGRGPMFSLNGQLAIPYVDDQPVSGVGLFGDDLQLGPVLDLPSLSLVDALALPSGTVALALSDPARPAANTCLPPTADRRATLWKLNSTLSCGAVQQVALVGSRVVSISELSRDFATPVFSTQSVETRIDPNRGAYSVMLGSVHAHDAALQAQWVETLEPISLPVPGTVAMEPLVNLRWGTHVLSIFEHRGTPLQGFKSSSGLSFRCANRGDARLVMTLHEPATGKTVWGACLLETPDANGVRRNRFTFRVRGTSWGTPLPTRVFGGVLLAPGSISISSSTPTPMMRFGSREYATPFGVNLLGLVTPPVR